jgi:undecaprenyl phosphate-alpha-L-ara4N flippase subunit ArnE
MSASSWLMLGLVVVLGTTGQLALKYGLRRTVGGRTGLGRVVSPPILVWLLSYVITTLLWLVALRTIPLSQAFPILGLQFALIPLASSRLLNEQVTPLQWVGVAVITAGVALVGQS